MPIMRVKRTKKSLTDEGREWHLEVKLKAATLYSQGMGATEISREMSIPLDTIKKWKSQDWWKDALKSLQEENYHQLDKQLTSILEESLTEIQDRLKSGDAIFNPRTGRINRVPVKLRDLNTTFSSVMSSRQTIRNLPSKIVESSSSQTALLNLAEEFAKFVGSKDTTKPEDVFEMIEGDTVVQAEDGSWVMAVEKEIYDEEQQEQELTDAIHEERET